MAEVIMTNQVIEQLDYDKPEDPLAVALALFESKDNETLLYVVDMQIEQAASAIARGEPVGFFLAERTPKGETPYGTYAFYDPSTSTMTIARPTGESKQDKKEVIPGVFHAVRAMAATIQRARKIDSTIYGDGINAALHDVVAYPALVFASRDEMNTLWAAALEDKHMATAIIPLVAQPKNADVLEFTSQSKGMSAVSLVNGFYEAMQQEDIDDPLRVIRLAIGNHSQNTQVRLYTTPNEEVKGKYKQSLRLEWIKLLDDPSGKSVTVVRKEQA